MISLKWIKSLTKFLLAGDKFISELDHLPNIVKRYKNLEKQVI